MSITLTNVNVLLSKPSLRIVSGSGAISITSTKAASVFGYMGVLFVKGGNQATLTVGSTIYLINLLTGTYTKSQ
ncbi:hypothetical protein [Mucilaginibacter sp. UYCu711]|uniref:hypothetical protein n=1 Tax=Mucilaginibacter sp. UYCu711 TaxID=3156339 RepID=UPI003D263EE7